MTARVLLIDNYDSFTYNLAHGLAEQGAHVDVFRHDELTEDEAMALQPTHLVISPGPGRPSETGISADLIERLHGRVPILGVCLGHQLLAEMHGGTVTHAQRLVHGKAGMVEVVADDPLLAGLGDRFEAGRYHSLAAIEPLPADFLLTARAADGEVMAMRHRSAPTHGVQFHPESILTPLGPRLLRNFLELTP
jgi:anthranilate synthase component 2